MALLSRTVPNYVGSLPNMGEYYIGMPGGGCLVEYPEDQEDITVIFMDAVVTVQVRALKDPIYFQKSGSFYSKYGLPKKMGSRTDGLGLGHQRPSLKAVLGQNPGRHVQRPGFLIGVMAGIGATVQPVPTVKLVVWESKSFQWC